MTYKRNKQTPTFSSILLEDKDMSNNKIIQLVLFGINQALDRDDQHTVQ